MSKMLIAAFKNADNASLAVDELEKMGFAPKDMSVISRENIREERKVVDDNVTEGAKSGAATGGLIGGLAGLLAGAGVVPALAGLLIGGPIAVALGATGVVATTISGAVTGAAAGGLIGALAGLGVPEESAKYYNETVESGGIVIAVPSREGEIDNVRNVLAKHSAERVTEVDLRV